MQSEHRHAAFAALIASILFWSSSPVFIQYLKHAYDPYSQALVRYACGAGFLLAVSAVRYPRELLAVFRRPAGVLVVAFFNTTMQVAWTVGIYASDTATLPQLIARITVVFVIIISYFVFHEERAVIRHPYYALGTVVSFGGLLLVLASEPGSLMPVVDFAVALMLLAAVLWAAYAVASKHVVLGVHPIPMFTGVAVFTTLFFVPLSLLFGEPAGIVNAGAFLTVVAFLSGVVPIALAHSSYNAAQKRLGSAFCSSFIIVLPLFTYLQAKLVLEDERVTAVQWLGAAILLSGTFLVTRASVVVHRSALAAAGAGKNEVAGED